MSVFFSGAHPDKAQIHIHRLCLTALRVHPVTIALGLRNRACTPISDRVIFFVCTTTIKRALPKELPLLGCRQKIPPGPERILLFAFSEGS